MTSGASGLHNRPYKILLLVSIVTGTFSITIQETTGMIMFRLIYIIVRDDPYSFNLIKVYDIDLLIYRGTQ